jgi:hypothetical protein
MKKESTKIEFNERRSVSSPLTDAWHEENDFMEVTEWSNGEGWDVQINDNQHFSIHFTEWEMLKKLIKTLEKRKGLI